MNIMIFDTETAGGLNKPFAYNIGYVIYNVETKTILLTRDFVVEQIWHNAELFDSAYYKDKRPIYVTAMRRHDTIMDKFGYITQQMKRDIKAYEVISAYAYNSPFDTNVFEYGCNWFHCINPFDNIPVNDIRGYAYVHICDTDEYRLFCEENELFTENGNYSTTAEAVYRYISSDVEFQEEHTALSDSLIETQILQRCIDRGADITKDYDFPILLKRKQEKVFKIVLNKETILEISANSGTWYKTRNTLSLKKED